jgi:hypothetical protein
MLFDATCVRHWLIVQRESSHDLPSTHKHRARISQVGAKLNVNSGAVAPWIDLCVISAILCVLCGLFRLRLIYRRGRRGSQRLRREDLQKGILWNCVSPVRSLIVLRIRNHFLNA